jgi:hypothetical protein
VKALPGAQQVNTKNLLVYSLGPGDLELVDTDVVDLLEQLRERVIQKIDE